MLDRNPTLTVLGTIAALLSACSAHDSGTVDPGTADTRAVEIPFDPGRGVAPAVGAFEAGAQAIALQDDGKIVVAGDTKGFTGLTEFTVARYNADGTLDTSFDGDGMAITSIKSASHTGMSVAIQSDHKIVIVGYLGPPGSRDFAVARYNADGSLDSSFGSNGTAMTSLSNGNDEAMAVAIQDDGRIVVAGVGASQFELVRCMPDGSLDSTFGDAGIVLTSPGHNAGAWGVAIQADRKIVVAGGSGSTVLARYFSNGKLDPSFDGDGIVVTDIGPIDEQAHALAIRPDGKIVVGGYYSSAMNDGFSLVRYKPDGKLDKSFGVDGILKTSIANDDGAYAVIIQPDGKIITIAEQSGRGSGEVVIRHYDANGHLDTVYGND